MEDFMEQYHSELAYQEVKANKHTLKGFCWFLVALTLIWFLTVMGFFEVDKKLITLSFLSNIVLFVPAFYIYLKISLSNQWIKYFLLSLICVATAVIVTFLSYHAVLIYVVPLLFAVQYRRRSTIWFVYAVNTVTMLISSLASFFYGICDLNLLLQSQHVRSWYLEIITADALNIPFNENPIFIIIVFEVFPRSIILLVFSIMMQYSVVSSNEDAYRIAKLTYLKETDTKTRVFNKNKYVEMAAEYYPKIDQIAVLFWDLNNLKYINDVYGHAMGDTAIETISAVLLAHSGDSCRVYRIGGDEFLMILDNPGEDEAEHIIQAVQEEVAAANKGKKIKVSSAVGYARGRGQDIEEVVKAADVRMYENKKQSKKERK